MATQGGGHPPVEKDSVNSAAKRAEGVTRMDPSKKITNSVHSRIQDQREHSIPADSVGQLGSAH